MMTSRRPTRRRLRRSNVAAAAIFAGSLSVAHAADSAVEWQFAPGTGKRVDVPSCHDQQGLVLSAANASSTGAVNAKIQFHGSSITLYGTRYDNGAPALIVVDGNYSSAIHADESLTATDGESPNSCILLASFTGLGINTIGHTVEIILPGDAVAPMTFTIANVTTSETSSNPGVPNPGSSTSPTESHSSNPPTHGPNIAAIVGPIVAVVLLIAGGVVLWLLRRRRIRNAKKAPSAAFRAQHPALPMGNIHNPNAGGQTEDDISPRHRSLSPSHALAGPSQTHIHSAGSSGTTLVADLDDEKKKLADILAVRDAHRLEIQAQLMSASARDAGERVPWDTRGGAGAGYGGWDAPGRGSGRGVPVAGWDPGDGERDARY